MLPASVTAIVTLLTEVTGLASWAQLLIAIPVASAAFLLLAGRRPDTWSHWLSLATSFVVACLGVGILMQVLGLPVEERVISLPLYRWFSAGNLSVDVDLCLDPLSLTFVTLVICVGFLIHLYPVACMIYDHGRHRFFAYLSLFIAAVLTLVLGDSYVVFFVDREGVGPTSYLLIGFWNTADADAPQGEQTTSRENATTAKEAFIMNRVDDVGLLLVTMTMVGQVGSVSFDTVSAASLDSSVSTGWLTTIGLFLLLAACGRSAQLPLQTQLNDAVVDPTPVSAPIHAATMVTAGVYPMVRSIAAFGGAPSAQTAVAVIDAITLLLRAAIGSAKDDMKEALAVFTMSQIGYMMLGVGLGPVGYAFAILRLLTHGFFKVQLFPGADSAMHTMDDQVNMRCFGGLRGAMMITWITMGIGRLAILGVPLFSDFWSKGRLIEAAFVGEGAEPWTPGTIALLSAGLTAFYMSCLLFMIFHGKQRWTIKEDLGGEARPHESDQLMTLPLTVLSVFSASLGGLLTYNNMLVTWLEPITGHAEHGEPVLPAIVIMGVTLALAVVGILVAWWIYVRRPVPVVLQPANPLVEVTRKDMYQDTINKALAMRTGRGLVLATDAVERYVVDDAIEDTATDTGTLGRLIHHTEFGRVRSCADYMLAGTVLVLTAVLIARF